MKKIKFPSEPDSFFKELSSKVNEYFTQNSIPKHGNRAMYFKISMLFGLYCLIYSCIYIVGNNPTYLFIIYPILGAFGVFLGLNIGHDAAHNAIFKKPKHNKRLLIIFEILGTSSYNWKNRHLGAHHTFPNVMDYDSDIQQTNIVKIFPKDEHKDHHAFQHFYMPVLYLAYIFRWIFYRDFKDSVSKNIGVFDNSNYPRAEIIKMVLFKLLYVVQMIVLPSIFLELPISTIILAFISLVLFGSIIITLVLLSTHVGEDSHFPEPNEDNVLPHSWSHHQVYTTSDFSTNSFVVNNLFGGFNHHAIHHLFPHICHIHYPAITPILKEVCEKYELPYSSKKYLISAVISHFKLLKNNSLNNAVS